MTNVITEWMAFERVCGQVNNMKVIATNDCHMGVIQEKFRKGAGNQPAILIGSNIQL